MHCAGGVWGSAGDDPGEYLGGEGGGRTRDIQPTARVLIDAHQKRTGSCEAVAVRCGGFETKHTHGYTYTTSAQTTISSTISHRLYIKVHT